LEVSDSVPLESMPTHHRPRVSIVMANYNYAQFVGQAIESVQRQDYRDWELIVVDDGSTDGSRDIIAGYLSDSRIRFRPVDHLGQAGAKNAGLEWCRGPLIAFLDADDLWEPQKLSRQVDLFERDPTLGLVCTGRRFINPEGRQVEGVSLPLRRGWVVEHLLRDNFVCFSSAMVRAFALNHVGWFDPTIDLAIDYDLWLRLAVHYRFDFVDQPLVWYRCGHGNLSRRVKERLQVATLILRRFLQHEGHRIDRSVVAEAQAAIWHHLGLAFRSQAPWESARWLLRSVGAKPGRLATWRSLASLLIPSSGRRFLRRLVGTNPDWENVYN
jgi:glycosyltransferase involved in cell wall biosynthesis